MYLTKYTMIIAFCITVFGKTNYAHDAAFTTIVVNNNDAVARRASHLANVERAFHLVESMVKRSFNDNAETAFNELISSNLEAELIKFEQSTIEDYVFRSKCALVPPACDLARIKQEAEYALRQPFYKKFIRLNHEDKKNLNVMLLKTCRDEKTCSEILKRLLISYTFEEQIRS